MEKDLQEFVDEGVGNDRGVGDLQTESPMAKRRKLHLAGWYKQLYRAEGCHMTVM